MMCLRGSNSTGSYKVSDCLFFILYISSCTVVSGFWFMFKFKSKSEHDTTGVVLDNGSVFEEWKTTCTKSKINLHNILENTGKIAW